jgi:hypothetical protein
MHVEVSRCRRGSAQSPYTNSRTNYGQTVSLFPCPRTGLEGKRTSWSWLFRVFARGTQERSKSRGCDGVGFASHIVVRCAERYASVRMSFPLSQEMHVARARAQALSHRGHERRAHAAATRATGLSCNCRRRPGAQMRVKSSVRHFSLFCWLCWTWHARPHSGAGGVRADSADMVSSAKKGLLYKLKGFQRRTKHSLFKVVQRARMCPRCSLGIAAA